MSATLYREIEALGGVQEGTGEYNAGWHDGYTRALELVLEILTKRGFSEFGDPIEDLCIATEAVLTDLGRPGADGWTEGYAHTTDIDRLTQAISVVRGAS